MQKLVARPTNSFLPSWVMALKCLGSQFVDWRQHLFNAVEEIDMQLL